MMRRKIHTVFYLLYAMLLFPFRFFAGWHSKRGCTEGVWFYLGFVPSGLCLYTAATLYRAVTTENQLLWLHARGWNSVSCIITFVLWCRWLSYAKDAAVILPFLGILSDMMAVVSLERIGDLYKFKKSKTNEYEEAFSGANDVGSVFYNTKFGSGDLTWHAWYLDKIKDITYPGRRAQRYQRPKITNSTYVPQPLSSPQSASPESSDPTCKNLPQAHPNHPPNPVAPPEARIENVGPQ